jgi:adenylate kinase family enzyme
VKVHIIGGPGAGKTRLSKQLGVLLGIPVHELDGIAGDGTPPRFLPSRPLHDRLADVEEIRSTPAWITEGSFLGWTGGLMEDAHLIVWLDAPRRAAMRRLALRSFGEAFRGTEGRRITLRPRVRWLVSFLRWCWQYYDDGDQTPDAAMPGEVGRAATLLTLAPFGDKIFRCDRGPSVDEIVVRMRERREAELAPHR